MGNGVARGVSIAVVVLAAAACSSGTSATSASTATTTTAPVSPAATASPAQPKTASEARSVAEQYFGLYAAGQYAAAYGLLAPSVQRTVSQATWVAVHQGCPAQSAGLAYTVSKATLTGDTAVVSVSLAGAAASLGSESEALMYSAGRWGLVPNDLRLYKHGSVKADIAAAKAAGYCASSLGIAVYPRLDHESPYAYRHNASPQHSDTRTHDR